MNRREAISSALAVPFYGIRPLPEATKKPTDVLTIDEGHAMAAVRFNGKTYALGIRLIPDDPAKTAKLVHALARTFEMTVNILSKFVNGDDMITGFHKGDLGTRLEDI